MKKKKILISFSPPKSKEGHNTTARPNREEEDVDGGAREDAGVSPPSLLDPEVVREEEGPVTRAAFELEVSSLAKLSSYFYLVVPAVEVGGGGSTTELALLRPR